MKFILFVLVILPCKLNPNNRLVILLGPYFDWSNLISRFDLGQHRILARLWERCQKDQRSQDGRCSAERLRLRGCLEVREQIQLPRVAVLTPRAKISARVETKWHQSRCCHRRFTYRSYSFLWYCSCSLTPNHLNSEFDHQNRLPMVPRPLMSLSCWMSTEEFHGGELTSTIVYSKKLLVV